ncbi:hypothetical protein CKA32_006038 [Geitlerinema sp. FC II]|nr:hypothetical protein CKA32_006038 [Geitlerinema sp. FC II]
MSIFTQKFAVRSTMDVTYRLCHTESGRTAYQHQKILSSSIDDC